MYKMLKKSENGFSLLELVVAVAVAGIIAAVAVPTFVGLQGDATTEAASYETTISDNQSDVTNEAGFWTGTGGEATPQLTTYSVGAGFNSSVKYPDVDGYRALYIGSMTAAMGTELAALSLGDPFIVDGVEYTVAVREVWGSHYSQPGMPSNPPVFVTIVLNGPAWDNLNGSATSISF